MWPLSFFVTIRSSAAAAAAITPVQKSLHLRKDGHGEFKVWTTRFGLEVSFLCLFLDAAEIIESLLWKLGREEFRSQKI